MNPFGADPLSVAPVLIEPTEYPKQKAWSISAVRSHAQCPQKFRFIRIDRLPEPEQPGGPLERGKLIHAALAFYLANGYWLDDIPEDAMLIKWMPTLDVLRAECALPEKQIAFTADWSQCEWYAPEVRARFVFDVIIPPLPENDFTVKVADWKTGRLYPTHIFDARMYALAALKMFPDAKRADVAFLYVDRAPARGVTYACERSVIPELEREADLFNHEFLNDTLYPARPGPHCRWCYQAKSAGGLCAFG